MATVPLMSRSVRETTEFRHDAPLWIAQVMQATAQARGISRAALVNDILGEFCKLRLTEATLIQRMTRGNPDIAEVLTEGPEA